MFFHPHANFTNKFLFNIFLEVFIELITSISYQHPYILKDEGVAQCKTQEINKTKQAQK